MTADIGVAAPIGEVGPDTDGDGPPTVECTRCGAEVPQTGHCAECGAFLVANTEAAVVGHRGRQFWAEHDRLYRALREEVATDLGHGSYDEAPAAARSAIDGLVQAQIVRDAAYRRVLEDGGPLSSKGRVRRAAKVQETYDRRVEAWVRRLGLKREPKPVPSLQEYMAEREAEGDGQ